MEELKVYLKSLGLKVALESEREICRNLKEVLELETTKCALL
jgi:hypothetical protein